MKIVLFLALIMSFVIPISAEAENQVSVSEIMFSGTEYLGTIFSEYEGLVTISSSDSSIAKVTSSLYFDGTQKQQMFKITPINDGTVTISAKFGSDEISENVRVYFPTTSQKTLELILPSDSTSVSDVVGYVYLLDFGNTMIASEDVDVLFTSKGDIQHPTKITILKGTTGASFDLSISGSSEITASSDSFESDTESIQFVPRKISVVIDAPHIVSANSLIYAVASFVENDMHYIPTQLRSATISSSDRNIISVSPTNTINQNETIYFDQDGIALIKLYSHNTGIARIDIHVSGFGSSSTEIFVGPSSIESGTINVNGTSSTLIEMVDGETKKSANTILGWAFPKINSGDLYLFAGSYFSKDTITLDVGEDNIQISYEATEYHPVVEQKSIYITSNGAVHDDVMILSNNEIPSNIGYVKISSSVGDFDFTISSPDILNPYTEQIEFGNPSYHSYQVNVVPLPVVHGYFQDVALIDILDNGVIINPHRTGQNTQFTATSNGIDVEKSIGSFDFGSSIAVISGGVKSGGVIDVSVSGIGTASGQIYLSKPNTESHSIRIFTPQSTYMEEPFSAYAFVVDSQGVPIRQVSPIASGMCQNIKNEIFTCDGIGTVSYFSEFGSVQKDVDLIYHQFDSVQIDMPSKLNVGEIRSASVGVDSDVEITVSSIIPNHMTGSDIIFEPDKTGKFDVHVTLEEKGYATKTLDFTIMVSDDIVIEVSASDGTNDIVVDVIVDGETKQTPFVITHQRKTVTLEFAERKISDLRNITFNNLMIDDLQVSQAKVTLDTLDHFAYDSEINIVAQYDPKLVVSIDGVQDTTYDFGETVIVLPANDKPVFALLVYEKFDGWISNDVQIETAADGTAVFEIKRNTALTSTYHTDYTNAGILVSIILALSMISLQRRNNKFMFMMFVDTLLRRNRTDEEEYDEEYEEVDDSKEDDHGEFEKNDDEDEDDFDKEVQVDDSKNKDKDDSSHHSKIKKWFFKV